SGEAAGVMGDKEAGDKGAGDTGARVAAGRATVGAGTAGRGVAGRVANGCNTMFEPLSAAGATARFGAGADGVLIFAAAPAATGEFPLRVSSTSRLTGSSGTRSLFCSTHRAASPLSGLFTL